MSTRIARIRKEQYGGNCAICNQPVELLTNCDPWMLKCGCTTVPIPNWANIDPYTKAQFRRRFEIKEIPTETKG
jgi:hypothetical protein